MTEAEHPDASDDAAGLSFAEWLAHASTSAQPPVYPSRRARREAEEAARVSSTTSESAPIVPVPARPELVPVQSDPVQPERETALVVYTPRPVERRTPPTVTAPRPQRAPRRTENRGLRQRISAAGAMTVIAGLFAALTLPAYAGGSETEQVLPVAQSVQGYEVSSVAAATEVTGDTYGATSGIEMRAAYLSALREANLRAYLASGAREMGDDYPWAVEPIGYLSPLNYYTRECVDFVAWRLNRDAGATGDPWKWTWTNLTPGGGNAISWKYAWEQHGWDTSSKPRVGWVAWFGGQNHVAYVSEVLDGDYIVVEEYNGDGGHVYGKRTIHTSAVTSFLAPPS